MKLTKSKIRKLIQEAVSSILTVPNLTKRSLPHDVQQEPIPPEFQMPASDYRDKIAALRSAQGVEAGKQTDELVKILYPGEYDMTHKGYAGSKAAHDKAFADNYRSDGHSLGDIEGVETLDADIAPEFSELGQYLEFSEHPTRGSMRDTILYRTYDDIASRDDVDVVRVIKILEDYLANDSSVYVADREKIEPETLNFLKQTIQELKDQKKFHFDHYLKDF
jgi:hypothetical protein